MLSNYLKERNDPICTQGTTARRSQTNYLHKMTGVKKLQEDEAWNIFLRWSCKKAHYHPLIQQEFEDLLWAGHSCSMHVWGCIDQLSEIDHNQSWHANTFSPQGWLIQYFKSTLRYNLLIIKCTLSMSSVSSDKSTFLCSQYPQSRKNHSQPRFMSF